MPAGGRSHLPGDTNRQTSAYLYQEILIVQLLELLEQRRAERQRLLVLLGVEEERHQPRLQRLAQEGALLRLGPVDTLLRTAASDTVVTASVTLTRAVGEGGEFRPPLLFFANNS